VRGGGPYAEALVVQRFGLEQVASACVARHPRCSGRAGRPTEARHARTPLGSVTEHDVHEDEQCLPASNGSCHGVVVASPERVAHLQQGLRLEILTVTWNIIEGLVSIYAAIIAGSVALLGFGVDSFVETTSGAILIWRLRAERRARDHEEIERLDHRARRLVGVSLFLLAAYVAFDAVKSLSMRDRPAPSTVGIVVTSISLVVMWWLARAKRRTAAALGSRALEADSFQTTACFWLSLIALVGIALNAALGWWWADPVAALGMTPFLVKEGREAWSGERCAC
jgi:Co/Zn/Cd efflux system component